MGTVVVNRVPGHLDLKGRQCRGVDARWRHCGLWRQEGEGRKGEDEGAREEGGGKGKGRAWVMSKRSRDTCTNTHHYCTVCDRS